MHSSRHRSPGGGAAGLRSNSMAASRISPEASLPRSFNYNRSSSFGGGGGGRGRGGRGPKPHPVPLPPPRKADILMEAGRLATEYLVSQGLLPPTVLSERWVNGNSKNDPIMDFQLTADARTPALSRLGNGGPDGFRNRTKRRMRDYGYDWGRDNTKTDSFLEKAPDMDPENDFPYGQFGREERTSDLDTSEGGVSNAADDEIPSKSDAVRNSDTVPHSYDFFDHVTSKPTSSTAVNQVPLAGLPQVSNASAEMKPSGMEIDKGTDLKNSDASEKQNATEDLPMHVQQMEFDITNKDGNDLLSLCSFTKVPTRTHSSLTPMSSKGDTTEEISLDTPLDGHKVSKENPSDNLLNFMLTNQTQDSKGPDSEVSRDQSLQTVGGVGVLGSTLAVKKEECAGPQSLLDRSATEQESGQVLSEFGRLNSMVKDRGDKRALQDDDPREGSKRPREWISTMVDSNDEYFHLLSSKPSLARQSNAPVEVVEIVDEDKLFDVSLLPRNESESGIEPKEEKQLFPHSFKICDLNLMESSDMTGTHDSDSVYGLPSTMEANKEVQVDVDLSMSNSCTRSDDFNRSATDAKDTEVVDLEDVSAKEDEDLDTSEKKITTAQASLGDFQNHIDSTGDHSDAQDGYGLMISELLGNDISSCSSVPADITGLHNEMGLPNGAEILDDDPIYLSLGEIPISFLGGWEQPPQPFEKPF